MGIYYSPGGLPLPDDADPVAQGAARIRGLGEAVDTPWTAFALTAAWVAQATYPPMYRVVAGVLYLRGTISTVAATWTGTANTFATLGVVGERVPATSAPLGLIVMPACFTTLVQPTTTRVGWVNVRAGGQLVAYAPATPADAIVLPLDNLSWAVTVVNPVP